MPKKLTDKKYKLQKYPGKGGWTYAAIDDIKPEKKNKFGWVQVSGSIDGFPLKRYKLMPMGNGNLFLPVRAEIRKKIEKQAGDTIHVILYADDSAPEIPQELLDCLADEPGALQFFQSLSDSEKQFYTGWIFSARKEETSISRMAKAVQRLSRGLKFYQTEKKE